MKLVVSNFLNFFVDKFFEKFFKKSKNVTSRKLKAFEQSHLAVACGKICNSLEYPDNTEL